MSVRWVIMRVPLRISLARISTKSWTQSKRGGLLTRNFKGHTPVDSLLMCLTMSGKSSELLPEIAMEQTTESKQFRWHGAHVLREQSEANVSALDDSLVFMKSGIIESIPLQCQESSYISPITVSIDGPREH